MISLYISQPTWLHKWRAGAKLLMLAACSIAVLPVGDWRVLLAGCAAVSLVYISLGRVGLNRWLALRALLFLILGLGVFQALVMTWQDGLLSVFRILFMVMLADLVTATTPMQDMIRAVMPVLKPLSVLGLKPDRLALAVALVIRFVPVLFAQWQSQSDAWRARSNRSPGIKLFAPFMSEALKRTDQIAESIAARKIR
ncbi:energy-coupling factor transporter transmembrane component T [beta proteobacterium MWH-UniP1]